MANGRREYISITILFVLNLLNYVDRYTIAGVLTDVIDYYKIDDGMAGLIQTVFLGFFMIGSPVCGYLGDRYNRKWIIVVGIVIWLCAVLASTFVPADKFWLFLLTRGMVGIGEASYSNISPSLISDMFTGVQRSRMYMLFFFAVPVGSGLGFVIGANVANALDAWQWGVRVTAIAGGVALIPLILFVQEPERGGADAGEGNTEKVVKGSYWGDLKALVRIPTFVFCTWGYTALVFVTGTLTWWEPTIIGHLVAWNKNLPEATDGDRDAIGLLFGGITTIAGLIGVVSGTLIAGWIIDGKGPFRCVQTPRAKPIVSGTGALLSAPILAVIFLFGHKSLVMLYCLMFLLVTCLSLNWGLNVDMLMGVIVPSRRSTAFSYFMLIAHLFGDASGPYLVGVISDAIRKGKKDPKDQYWALVYGSCMTVVLLVVSAVLYYITAACLVRDQKKFAEQMAHEDTDVKKSDSLKSLEGHEMRDHQADNISESSAESINCKM